MAGTATFSNDDKLTNGINHDLDAKVDGTFQMERMYGGRPGAVRGLPLVLNNIS